MSNLLGISDLMVRQLEAGGKNHKLDGPEKYLVIILAHQIYDLKLPDTTKFKSFAEGWKEIFSKLIVERVEEDLSDEPWE